MDNRSTTAERRAILGARIFECAPGCRLCAVIADRRPRPVAYADPTPRLHLTERDLRDAGDAGTVLLRQAAILGVATTVGT